MTIYLDLDEQEKAFNRLIDVSTLTWWATEHPTTFQAVLRANSDNQVPVSTGLLDVVTMINGCELVWANGPQVDIAVLRDLACASMQVNDPWPYWKVRDMRTIRDHPAVARKMASMDSGPATHRAVDDAIWQAEVTMEWLRVLQEDPLVSTGELQEAYGLPKERPDVIQVYAPHVEGDADAPKVWHKAGEFLGRAKLPFPSPEPGVAFTLADSLLLVIPSGGTWPKAIVLTNREDLRNSSRFAACTTGAKEV